MASRKQRQIRQKRVLANRARHRLLSIRHDVENIVQPFLEQYEFLRDLPLLANERCGSWYVPPSFSSQTKSCYFKSTDGHVGTWNLSLKRLNLNVIDSITSNGCGRGGGCLILDASVYKQIPDSFSRTIPMWAACMNRIAARYRNELGIHMVMEQQWDTNLYTPSWIVSEEEHKTMEDLIDTRVQELYSSHAIVDPHWLGSTLNKPLRPYWITTTSSHTELPTLPNDWYAIILLTCSEHCSYPIWKEKESFWYTPGAADDDELWARHLTPTLFWENVELLWSTNTTTDDETDQAMDAIVQNAKYETRLEHDESLWLSSSRPQDACHEIGETNLFIGTRRAGRPPDCWNYFDAILNVTDMEYPNMILHNKEEDGSSSSCCCLQNKFYLQLFVKEGKKDRTELERWMAVGIVFCVFHAQHNRRILIHCAQGKDRSVAIAMATLVLFCDQWTFPLRWKDAFWNISVQDLMDEIVMDEEEKDCSSSSNHTNYFQSSGLPHSLVCGLLGWKGRDYLFQWVEKRNLPSRSDDDDAAAAAHPPLATKETLRIVLHLIKQYREMADPTRSTMQKLNRFFMSRSNYYSKEHT